MGQPCGSMSLRDTPGAGNESLSPPLCLAFPPQFFRNFRQIQPDPQAHPDPAEVSLPAREKRTWGPSIVRDAVGSSRAWRPGAHSDSSVTAHSSPLSLSCSYYPLYPPQEDTAIDYENFYTYAQLPVTPDVFIVPSELRYFVKVGFGLCSLEAPEPPQHRPATQPAAPRAGTGASLRDRGRLGLNGKSARNHY